MKDLSLCSENWCWGKARHRGWGGGGGGAVGFHVVNRPNEPTTHYSADISIHSSQEPCLGILEKKKRGTALSELPLLFLLSIIQQTKGYVACQTIRGSNSDTGKKKPHFPPLLSIHHLLLSLAKAKQHATYKRIPEKKQGDESVTLPMPRCFLVLGL